MKKLLVLVAIVTVGCGGGDKPAQTPTAPIASAAPSTTEASPPAKSNQMAVNVDESIVKACKLNFDNAEQSPKFDYDSDALTQGEKNVLEAIAKCVTVGILKGRSLELLGRADPRGESEYNLSLGARRARSVHAFLAQLGVASEKMRDTSRGALDATGSDEAGWQKDRRVDVRLIP